MENNNPINTTQKEEPISIVDKPTDMGTPAQPSPKFLSKGVAITILIIILVIFISGAIFAAYDLGGKNQVSKQVSQTPTVTQTLSPSPATDPTASWQTFTGEDYSLKYPSNWKKIGNNIIAEKSFIPGEQVPGQNYNSVEIQKYANQIYKEYTNKEWFEKIQNLNQSDIIDDHGNSIERLGITGTTASGDRYVVVEITSPSSKSSLEDGIRQTKAYILKDQTIYQLTLDSSDNVGSEVFYKILPTFKITDSNSSASQNYLKIPEFGIKILLTQNNQDAYSTPIKTQGNNSWVYLKVHSLDSEPYCNDNSSMGIAALNRVAKDKIDERTQAIIDAGLASLIGNYYYFIEGEQAVCAQKTSNQPIETNARKSFVDASKNITSL